jgi:hypothetical protein
MIKKKYQDFIQKRLQKKWQCVKVEFYNYNLNIFMKKINNKYISIAYIKYKISINYNRYLA